MPTRVDHSIPPPTTWESFESLCRDLWAEVWNDVNTQRNGRQGQEQCGVDVFGEPKKGNWFGLQAKEKDQLPGKTITCSELHAEVEKAKNFTPSLKKYIIATTGLRDVKIQAEARKITEANRKKGLFDVVVYSWKDIEPLLKKHKNVFELHYPDRSPRPDLEVIKKLIEKREDQQNDNQAKTAEQINGVQFEVRSGFKHLAEQTSIGGDLTQEHHSELDYARDLINQHKPISALAYIEPIKNRIWNQTSQNIKFRLLTNIAAAKLQIGNDREAAQLFIEAKQYNPDDEKALCNVALAYILLDKPNNAEEYIKKILSKNPASGRTYSLLIQIRIDSSLPIEKIIKEIPSEYHDLPEIIYALGTACRRNKHFSEAQKWFEKLKTGKDECQPEYLVSLGTTLLASISKDMHLSFSKKLDRAEYAKVKEASVLFEKSWQQIKSYEDNSLKIECLVNMGTAHILLGDRQRASINFDDALVIEPNNPDYIFNRAYIDYEVGNSELALKRLKIISQDPKTPAAILIGDIYLSSGNRDAEILRKEALPVIENYIKLNPTPFLKGAAERQLVQLHISLNELKKATEIADQLVKDNPKHINSLVCKSRVHRLLKDDGVADKCLSDAEILVDESTAYFDLLVLADEFNFTGKFDKAAILYERIADIKVDDGITRSLIDTYLKSGNKKKALAVCESIRVNQGFIREILELEANLYEDIGDLASAEKLCKEYLREKPSDERVRLHLATINYRGRKFDQVDAFLKEIFNYKGLSLRHRIQYSELLDIRGFDKEAINVMYETRRKYFDQSVAHLCYVATLLRTNDNNNEWLHPKTVASNTAVLIQEDSGIKTWYLIEDRTDTDPAKNEFASQHSFSKKILEKVVGDEIELVSGGPQKKYGKILEIKSKYIYALHNSMYSYQTMFPEAEGLYRIDFKNSQVGKFDEKDLKILFDQIDKQHEQYEIVLKLYKEGKLTVGAMANILGKNPIEVWGLLTVSEDQEFKCAIGDVTLRRSVQEALIGKQKIVIDILSLMTIHGLEVADLIVKYLGKFLISQSTIDVLTDLISNRKGLFSKGFMTLGKQNGHYVKEKITAEQLNKNTEYLKKITKWIENNCVITPCTEILTLDTDHREKLYRLFGDSFIDSIFIAKQEHALFYSDDERLRMFGAGTYQVSGIWSQALLEKLLIVGALNNETYQDLIIKLVNSNYEFISINADTLIQTTKKSQWKSDRSFTKIVNLLNGNKCDMIPAIIVVADYINKILNQPIYLDDPKNICFVVLDNAIKDRINKKEFVEKLKFQLDKILILSPIKKIEAKKIIDTWLKHQIF
ncbi:MAG: hypothetical protein V1922_05275 [bacterium]